MKSILFGILSAVLTFALLTVVTGFKTSSEPMEVDRQSHIIQVSNNDKLILYEVIDEYGSSKAMIVYSKINGSVAISR